MLYDSLHNLELVTGRDTFGGIAMKKRRIIKFLLDLCLVIGMVMMPLNEMEAQAQEVIATVEGTVLSETTQELLHLSTKEGKMEIKLDSSTDASGCKLLLTGEKINVSIGEEE